MSGLFFCERKMLTEFENKVAGFIEDNKLFGPADKVLLAVSGGADSMTLLYLTCALKAEGVLEAEFVVGHINHQLRGADADGDEKFAAGQAAKLNLPVETRCVDVRRCARENKLSIETAGRRVRIENLIDIAKANGCSVVATAHQKNDNAETILQRLSRGTGFRGLGGIWPVRIFGDDISFVRPLLCVSRDEIIGYLKGRNLKWRLDKTNEDYSYRRNFIRLKLIPVLQKQYKGSLVEELFELSQSARRFYKLVCSFADNVWPELADCSGDKVTLDLEKFSNQPVAVKVELVRRSLAELGSGERDLTQGHFEGILQLAERKTGGKKIELPGGFVAGFEYGKLVFTRRQADVYPGEKTSKVVKLEVPGQTRFRDCLIEAEVFEADKCSIEEFKAEKNEFVEWFDLDKLNLPLEVRFRRVGDKFWPLGLAGEKRVGKFLTAEKVPQQLREKVLVVANSEKIIWIWPIRISEKVRVTVQTQRILQLRITEA